MGQKFRKDTAGWFIPVHVVSAGARRFVYKVVASLSRVWHLGAPWPLSLHKASDPPGPPHMAWALYHFKVSDFLQGSSRVQELSVLRGQGGI